MKASQVVLLVKNPSANTGDVRVAGLISGSGRSPGEGNGIPVQYSCLRNPMDRGGWRSTVLWVAKSWTTTEWLSTHHCTSPKLSSVLEISLSFWLLFLSIFAVDS